jgi:hypothetical protein
MAQAGAVLQRHAAPRQGYRHWPVGEARHAERFRKIIVVASLVIGDVVAAMAALALGNAIMALGGLALPDRGPLSIALLVLTFFGVRLYTGCGPSPYERFRLRSIGIVAFVAIDLLVRSQGGDPGRLLVAGLCESLLLLVFGHYVEAMVRSLLIRLDLWGASTALIGCGESSRRLASLLAQQPALGLMPIGFIETPGDGALRSPWHPPAHRAGDLRLCGRAVSAGIRPPGVDGVLPSAAGRGRARFPELVAAYADARRRDRHRDQARPLPAS